MAVKISLPGLAAVTMRLEGGRVDVEIGSNGVRIVIADAEIEGFSVVIGSRNRGDARGRRRRVAGRSEVTPEMEAAAVEAFLAGADVARLGRSLASVYQAMDAVRSRRQEFDDDD